MDKKLAMKWVKALRSGKYKQGANKLRDSGDNFCCLGVLCDIENMKPTLDGDRYRYNNSTAAYTGKSLKTPTGRLDGKIAGTLTSSVSLANLNDGSCRSVVRGSLNFDEIADIIQICYKEL